MAHYNTWNVKLPKSQLKTLKSGIKNGTEITLNLSSNLIGNSNNKTNFPHNLLLTNNQIWRFCKVVTNNSSADKKLFEIQSHKIGQSGGFLGRLLGPLLKTGLLWTKNVLKPFFQNVLIPLGFTAAASATDAAIQKKFLIRYDNFNNFKWRNAWYYEKRLNLSNNLVYW